MEKRSIKVAENVKIDKSIKTKKGKTSNEETLSISKESMLPSMPYGGISRPISHDFELMSGYNLESSTAEKIMLNANNLLNIAWLNRGLELSKAVCRIVTPAGLGSGWLISSDLLLTNNHVLPDKETAEKSKVQFNYQKDWFGHPEPVQSFTLDANHFRTNESLDYTIVRVNGNPGNIFGYIDLKLRKNPVVNDYVSIIQHPNGGFKQIALTDNKVTAVFGNVVQYVTDTEPGSSGSPVFDQDWKIVGLHHAGGMLPGPDGKEWFCNEGILINVIIQDAQDFLGITDPLSEINWGKVASGILTAADGLDETKPSDNEINFNKVIKGLITTGSGLLEDIQPVATRLLINNPNFKSKLQESIMINKEDDNELLPIVAAAIGVASGAAIRHWGNSKEIIDKKSIDNIISETGFIIPDSLYSLMEEQRNSECFPSQIYSSVLANARNNVSLYITPLLEHMDSGLKSTTDAQEFLPVLTTAFLAGVGAGAAAYGGR